MFKQTRTLTPPNVRKRKPSTPAFTPQRERAFISASACAANPRATIRNRKRNIDTGHNRWGYLSMGNAKAADSYAWQSTIPADGSIHSIHGGQGHTQHRRINQLVLPRYSRVPEVLSIPVKGRTWIQADFLDTLLQWLRFISHPQAEHSDSKVGIKSNNNNK